MSPRPPSREDIERLLAAVREHGTKADAARALGIARTTLREQLEIGARLYGTSTVNTTRVTPDSKGRREVELQNGLVIAGSDPHYWPGNPSTAHRAMVMLCKKLKPQIVVLNGDAMDFPRISRHPVPGWNRMVEVKDEFEVTTERMHELAEAAGKAQKFWSWGNHDQRWEVYLASNCPEVSGVPGMRLCDHFPLWEPCWSVFVNNRPGGLVIKHRYKNGIHATWNNVVHAQRHIATGHLHSQRVTPHTTYNGTLYGIDMGCLADIYGPQFQYLEDNPRNWVAGLAVFTFKDGEMLPPELVTVLEPGVVFFRGQQIEV
jgi:hypothetical protein